jgi:hypothetical protein
MVETIATALCSYTGSPVCSTLCEYCLDQAQYILDAINGDQHDRHNEQPASVGD